MKTLLLLCSLPLAVFCWAQNNVSEPFNSNDIWLMSQKRMPDDDWDKRNQKHQLDSTISKAYDVQLGTWYTSGHTMYTYYPSGKIKSSISETHQVSQEIERYDENGAIESMVIKNWNGSQYVEDYKAEYHFGNQGNSRVDSIYTYSGGAWQIDGYMEYVFDTNGNMQEQWGYQLNAGLAEPTVKYIFGLNANGRVDEMHSYSYVNGQWENFYHYTFEYDIEDRETTFSYKEWQQSAWVNVFKLENQYSAENLLETNESFWEPTGWTNRRNTFYEFDNSIATNDIVIPFPYRANGHKIIGKSSSVNYFGQWFPSDSVSFYYSGPEPNSIDESNSSLSLEVLGNPIRENLRIANSNLLDAKVRVFDVTGKMIDQFSSRNSLIEHPVDAWQNGIYFVNIITGKDSQILRVVKE